MFHRIILLLALFLSLAPVQAEQVLLPSNSKLTRPPTHPAGLIWPDAVQWEPTTKKFVVEGHPSIIDFTGPFSTKDHPLPLHRPSFSNNKDDDDGDDDEHNYSDPPHKRADPIPIPYRYPQAWDYEYSRPIVDGKILNPYNGRIEKAGTWFYFGAPNIDVTWHNMNNSQETWTTVRFPYFAPTDVLMVKLAQQVAMGLWKVHQVSLSETSARVFGFSDKGWDELFEALSRLYDP